MVVVSDVMLAVIFFSRKRHVSHQTEKENDYLKSDEYFDNKFSQEEVTHDESESTFN